MTAFNLVSLLLFNDTIVQGEMLTKVKETQMPRMADAYRPRCSAHHPAVIGDCSPLELARAAPPVNTRLEGMLQVLSCSILHTCDLRLSISRQDFV